MSLSTKPIQPNPKLKQFVIDYIKQYNPLESIILILGIISLICETIDKLPIIWYIIYILILVLYSIDKLKLYKKQK